MALGEGCFTSEESGSNLPEEFDPPLLSAARYRVEWDQTGVKKAPEGGGLTFSSDLGYVLTLTAGYVTNHSLSLVPCPTDSLAAQRVFPWQKLGAWLGIPSAWAGHSGSSDPSSLDHSRVDSLTESDESVLGEVAFPAATYCRVFHLIAEATEDMEDLPASPDMMGLSLWLEGTFQAPGSEELVPFQVSTASAHGRFDDLETSVVERAPGDGPFLADVLIRRRLSTLFDGVELGSLSSEDAAREVLANVVGDAVVEVGVEESGGL